MYDPDAYQDNPRDRWRLRIKRYELLALALAAMLALLWF